MSNNQEKRESAYDILRIIACFLVILNHTISGVFFQEGENVNWYIANFLFNSCRANVVIFIFLSGALLLPKDEDYRTWLKKRVLRIVYVIFLFSILYYPLKDFSIIDYICTTFSNNVTNAFWYLYLYLTIMIALPAIRVFVKSMNKECYILLTVVFLVVQSVYPLCVRYFSFPTLNSMTSSVFSYSTGWIYIFISGYYYRNLKIVFSWKKALLLLAIWGVGNGIPTILTANDFFEKGDRSLYLDNPFFIWSLLATIALVCLVKMICERGQIVGIKHQLFSFIAGTTFGIYLLSDWLCGKSMIMYNELKKIGINPVVSCLIWDITIFFTGGIITVFLKRIPWIKKLL